MKAGWGLGVGVRGWHFCALDGMTLAFILSATHR